MATAAKELLTARIDGDLKRAVAAKAAERGETVTEVIVRAFTAYIQADLAGQAASPAPPPSVEPVYTRPPAQQARVSLSGQCPPHPKARVIKGFCGACGRSVLND